MALETYIKAVTQDIECALHQEPKKYLHDNLTKQERRALISHGTRTDIIIEKADRGLATVVMLREDYVTKVMEHLNNEEHYKKL